MNDFQYDLANFSYLNPDRNKVFSEYQNWLAGIFSSVLTGYSVEARTIQSVHIVSNSFYVAYYSDPVRYAEHEQDVFNVECSIVNLNKGVTLGKRVISKIFKEVIGNLPQFEFDHITKKAPKGNALGIATYPQYEILSKHTLDLSGKVIGIGSYESALWRANYMKDVLSELEYRILDVGLTIRVYDNGWQEPDFS